MLWTSVAPADGEARIIPDGCMDLLWFQDTLLVAGPDTGPFVIPSRAGALSAGLRFAPGTAPGVLGIPAHEARDQRVPLEAIWPAGLARRAVEAVGGAPDRAAALETVAADLYAAAEPADPLIDALVARIRRGTPIARVADQVGLSQRQLLRRCLPAFGYGPKTLARILRAQRALSLARANAGFAAVAAAAGYADQAHLSREIRALTGSSLGELAR
jgi:AraC-like DNA-binding protein